MSDRMIKSLYRTIEMKEALIKQFKSLIAELEAMLATKDEALRFYAKNCAQNSLDGEEGQPTCFKAREALALTPADVVDRVSKVRIILKAALEENDTAEINPSNYSHDYVCNLNNAYVILFYRVEEALEFIESARAAGVEVE